MTGSKLSIAVNSENCVGCRVCQMRCSFRFTKYFSFTDAMINVNWKDDVCRYEVSFKETCENCGLCALFCVYGCLSVIKSTIQAGAK